MMASSVTPILVQAEFTKLDQVMNKIDMVQSIPGATFPRFSMFGMFATQSNIKLISNTPGVQAILPDLPIKAFDQYAVVGDLQSVYIGTKHSRTYLGADIAEQQGITGKGVKVAIIDTGVFNAHKQLMFKAADVNAILPAPELPAIPSLPPPISDRMKLLQFSGTPVGMDDNGHGTHCVTTVGGNEVLGPNNIECKGVAPGAGLLSIKVLGTPLGVGMSSDIIRGIDIAISRGAKVISMSLGASVGDNNTAECLAIKTAMNLDPKLVFVVAGGNFGPGGSTMGSPACSQEALTVGSMSIIDNAVSYFSSRGPTTDGLVKPDVIAPGGGRKVEPVDGVGGEYIFSGTSIGTILDIAEDKSANGWAALHGTSMACPHVAGLVALLKQYNPDVTTDYIKQVMQSRGKPKDNISGWGPINYQMFFEEKKE